MVEMMNHDLSIFDKDDNQCVASDYTKCYAMKRLISSSKYHSMLNKTQFTRFMKTVFNMDCAEVFTRFMNEVYNGKGKGLIDDYIHFQEHHEHEIERINRDLIESNRFSHCSIVECEFTRRHMHVNAQSASASDTKLCFYGETFDALHFHLFHCFEAGLRMRISDDDDEMEEEEKEKATKDDYFDVQFARMSRRILGRQHNTASFDRFSRKNTKFSIVNDEKLKRDTNNKHNRTYLDEIVKHLLNTSQDEMQIKHFMHFIFQQQYDTDAIDHDHTIKPNGNIMIYATHADGTLLKYYHQFISDTKLESSSFNIGFRFYYWRSYKGLKELNNQYDFNLWDHSGYDINELFIEAKYTSFKEEIAQYKYVTLTQYEANITVKVNQYLQAEVMKQTTAIEYVVKDCAYDIAVGDAIRFEHLLALVLYTDYAELSTHFSATFRKNNAFETIASVRKRNGVYYWMSRRLRECVEIFGQCADGDYRYTETYTALSGPYFCGMNGVMSMPSFSMRLCSPTSTSKQIEVAMKFSGGNGIVLQMDNPIVIWQCVYLHAFNASWVSRFKEEDERLFFGGMYPIQIQSILIRSTKQNFEKFIRCLHYLDILVTGGNVSWMKVTENDLFVISSLMNGTISDINQNEIKRCFDDYIHSTFNAFTRSKKQIVLHLDELNDANRNVTDLFMNRLSRRISYCEKKRRRDDFRNLCKAQLFQIFKNVKSVVFVTTQFQYSYSISMFGLLSLIKLVSLDKVILKAGRYYYSQQYYEFVPSSAADPNTWIEKSWRRSSASLIKHYGHANYAIECVQVSKNEFQFVITSKQVIM
eukprot:7931_1